MGQSSSGAPITEQFAGEITHLGSSKLVVTHVEVVRQREVIKVPVIEEVKVPTTRYVEQVEKTVRYEPAIEQTTKYETVVAPTTQYLADVKETTRYVVKDVPCERPVVTDKLYERPVIQEKVYQLISFADLEAIKEAMTLLPKLIEEIKELRKIRIVEELVKVPKIEYVPTTIMRLTKSGELVKDAD